VRRSRATAALLGVACAGLVAVAAVAVDEVKEVVKAHRLEIIDDGGKVCAALSAEDGTGKITLFSHDRPVVLLGAEQANGVWTGTVTTMGAGDQSVVVSVVEPGQPVRLVKVTDLAADPKIVDTNRRAVKLKEAIDHFKRDFHRLPASLDDLLVPTEQNANEAYVVDKDALLDAWGTTFAYTLKPNDTYELVSLGEDGTVGGEGLAKDIPIQPRETTMVIPR